MLWNGWKISWKHLWENWFPKKNLFNCGRLKKKEKKNASFAWIPHFRIHVPTLCNGTLCGSIGSGDAPIINLLLLKLTCHHMSLKSVGCFFQSHTHAEGSQTILLASMIGKSKFKQLSLLISAWFSRGRQCLSVTAPWLGAWQERGKCVTKICSSIHFPFEAWNTWHDLEPNSNPVPTVTMAFQHRGESAVVCRK